MSSKPFWDYSHPDLSYCTVLLFSRPILEDLNHIGYCVFLGETGKIVFQYDDFQYDIFKYDDCFCRLAADYLPPVVMNSVFFEFRSVRFS